MALAARNWLVAYRGLAASTAIGCRLTSPLRTSVHPRIPVQRLPLHQQFISTSGCYASGGVIPPAVGPVAVPDVSIASYDDVYDVVRKKQITIVDVRKPDEVEASGRIPESVVLPVDDIKSAMNLSGKEFKLKYKFEKPTDPLQTIIFYCQSGRRAERAAKMFRDELGFVNVINYVGSWKDWSVRHPEHIVIKPVAKEKKKRLLGLSLASIFGH